MYKTIIICVAIICATVIICYTVVWVSKYAQSNGFINAKNVRATLFDLQEQINKLRNDNVLDVKLYDGLRHSIDTMQKRIKELEENNNQNKPF